MAKATQFVVVSYDVPDDRRRTRVMKTLLDFGQRVQFSVFECDLKAKDLDRLLKKLTRLVKPEEDNVRLYLLCEACLPKTLTLGVDTGLDQNAGPTRIV